MTDLIKITNDALKYLSSNLILEKEKNLIIYISVTYPYTQYAYVNITYCKKEDLSKNDVKLNLENIDIYLDEKIEKLIKDAVIDIKENTLKINAPNLFNNKKNEKYDIKDQIKILFETEINTMLSQHGGFIELIDIENDETLIIKFHGGCQGCGMVNFTMTNYIEKIIKKNFPQINEIKDTTSHEIRKNSYY
ncbi:NifU family protein [Candidatus Azoamicus ciliaticola]|uniref:Fe/S biogenesis protein NfuA n=1 Tax=Candidatus Azoamicus ciliaticola TaxID=2652803 RepID=A0A6J5JZB5_9GAMM|nr:NifU family protein [Candidatus Azoamicus ciliaticola]CAB3976370.1 Fe/S biogenesis protein NfuA [Candidatus Azoamicus ciliaticola]